MYISMTSGVLPVTFKSLLLMSFLCNFLFRLCPYTIRISEIITKTDCLKCLSKSKCSKPQKAKDIIEIIKVQSCVNYRLLCLCNLCLLASMRACILLALFSRLFRSTPSLAMSFLTNRRSFLLTSSKK